MKKEMALKYDIFGAESLLERSEEEFSAIIVADKVDKACLNMLNS